MIHPCITYFTEIKQVVPGILKFHIFEIPQVGHTHRGTNAITQIGLLVPTEASLIYWKARFEEHGVKHSDITTYANHPALHFEDSEGLRMVLLVSNGAKVEHWETWEKSQVPVEHQIQGMGSVEMTVRRLDKLARTLTDMFGYTEVSAEVMMKQFSNQ